jgi:dihydroorotase
MIISPDGKEITMRTSDNWHAHLRQGELLEFLVPVFIDNGWRGRVLAEPNTVPPLLTGEDATAYGREIEKWAKWWTDGRGIKPFEPVVTIQVTESTTPEMVRHASELGVRVAKVYPRYVTTHSENGVSDYHKIYPALGAAEESGMIVQFHPEHPSYNVEGRFKESAFRTILDKIVAQFPGLKISVEHVSSRLMVEWVKKQGENVGASVTIHHIYQTSDDFTGYSQRSGGLVSVHDGAFKPCAKDRDDRQAIQNVTLEGNPKFWSGNDDAAHVKSKKHCGACGAWNTIPALSMTLSFFERNKALEKAEAFLSEYGARFYGYPLNEGVVTFRREEWQVPDEVMVPSLNDSIVPFYAGETMQWKLV